MTRSDPNQMTIAPERALTNHRFDEEGTTALPHPLTLTVVPATRTSSYKGMKRTMWGGIGLMAVMVSAATVLIAQTVIAGAVVSSGVLIVESGSKAVQHPYGGVVAELLVHEDEKVIAGQPLIRLDTVVAQAQADSARVALIQQQARYARLTAERDGRSDIDFSAVGTALADPRYAEIFASERQQFNLRKDDRDSQRAQLQERIQQAQNEADGYRAQQDAAQQELAIAAKELEGLHDLLAKKLVAQQRVTELERTHAQLLGSINSAGAAIASSRGKMAELTLMVMQVDQKLRSEITDQVAETQANISALTEKQVSASTILARSEIVAPVSGVIHELDVHTVGGVIEPAKTLMTIVPESDRLVGDVRIRPNDIDELYPTQPATVAFSAFDRGTTPQVTGQLASISPDLQEDRQTGAKFYSARIAISPSEVARLGDVRLVAGMPLEAFIRTNDRTILSYFLKPITDQMNRAFR